MQASFFQRERFLIGNELFFRKTSFPISGVALAQMHAYKSKTTHRLVLAQAMSRERFLIENIFFCEKLYFL